MDNNSPYYIGYTTFPNQEIAEQLASYLITNKLAYCIQIDGPIKSFFQWKKLYSIQIAFHICIKFNQNYQKVIEAYLMSVNPYDIYQWICIKIDYISKVYHNWLLTL